jgi:hypothetical protein
MVGAKSGKVLDTENEDMNVDAEGNMVPKKAVSTASGTKTNNSKSRRLDEAGGIKTAPSLQKVELASTLPDKTLMSLKEITVYSDKGHTLRVQIHGFSRVPVLNSKCGNVVHFYTAWKGRITLDSKDMSFDDETAKEFKNAGFSLAVGGYNGRRLSKKSKADTFFGNMETLKKSGAWKCAGVALPEMAKYNKYTATEYLPCGAKTTPQVIMDRCDSRYGGLIHGAGFLNKHDARAIQGKTASIRALLKKSTPEIIYQTTTSYTMTSKKYKVTFATYPQHFSQELVTIVDRESSVLTLF